MKSKKQTKQRKNKERVVQLKDEFVFYRLKRYRRSRSIRIVVDHSAKLKVSIPYWVSIMETENFLRDKADWILSKISEYKSSPGIGFLLNSESEYNKHKEKALCFVSEKVDYFNCFYDFEYNKISIRKQESRWGSCSSKKNLNFNYKICFLPEHLADYIIVHELCHLKELNHSKKFWDLVEKTVPDYKKRVKELRSVHLLSPKQ